MHHVDLLAGVDGGRVSLPLQCGLRTKFSGWQHGIRRSNWGQVETSRDKAFAHIKGYSNLFRPMSFGLVALIAYCCRSSNLAIASLAYGKELDKTLGCRESRIILRMVEFRN